MIQSYKSKHVLIVDNGIFVELAVTLAQSFGKVSYYSAWESQFPTSASILPSKNLPGVERVNKWWPLINDVDLFVFPEIYYGEDQLVLEDMGKRVWGSRMGEELELDRISAKKYMKKLGIKVADYEIVTGIQDLRKYLKSNKDKWVKISFTRGDMETFHVVDYDRIEPELDELEFNLGAGKKKITEFMVESAINDAIEIAYDGPTVDGKFPKRAVFGIESKNKAYIGLFKDYKKMPEDILDVNSKLSDTLKKYKYRNWLALEMRKQKNKTAMVVDPCCRFGSPPGELMLIMYKNLPDLLWFGAEGKMVEPEEAGAFGAELIIHHAGNKQKEQAIKIPPKIRENVKIRDLTMINGVHYSVPAGPGSGIVGGVVAVGNTMEEAKEKVKEYASQIEGTCIDIFPEALDDVEADMEKAKEFGVDFL